MLVYTGGLTTYAAQGSLPNEPLYPLKLWSESVRLDLAGTQQDWQLALEFAEQRAAEIRQMVVNGQSLPLTLQMRLMLQIDQALQLAVRRPDDEALQALEQVRQHLEEQEQEMVMLQGGFGPQADAELIRAREAIREGIRWVESGIQEPNQLREHFRLRLQKPEITSEIQELHRYSGTAAPGGSNQYGAGECPECTPQRPQNGGNPWTTGTPTPGSGFSEGWGGNPWQTGTPTPGGGHGEGQGGNPWTTSTSTPGSGYGPGLSPNPTSIPTGQGGSGSGGNTGGSNTPEPPVDPGSGPGPNPTDDSGGGSGSQPTDTGPGHGGQPGQGGTNP